MKILAIDTSNRPLSVAIMDGTQLLAETTLTTHRKHAEFLMPIIEDLTKKAELTPSDIKRVVVATGPGSYTGIRMATTVAKTLASTLRIELVTVSSLLTLALNINREGVLINPIFNARNQNIFTGLYRYQNGEIQQVIPDQHTTLNDWLQTIPTDTRKVTILGETAEFVSAFKEKFGDRLQVGDELDNLPNAAKLGAYGAHLQPVSDIDAVVPQYLRLTKAEADWKKLHPNEDTHHYVEKL